MRSRLPFMWAGVWLAAIACQSREAPPPAAAPPTAAPAAPATLPPATTAPIATAAPTTVATPPVTGLSGVSLAAQDTNWPGVVAEVTEFRRRGNTLTLRLRLRNRGTERPEPDIHWNDAYVMDPAGGKKYEVLRDEKGAYIAALHTGYGNRWYFRLDAGQEVTTWAKFPAPPPEVKAVTLQVPGIPPFDDLAIQDS